jgi:SAM-dependent methyltransferase
VCLELARRHPGWHLVAADLALQPLRRGRRWAREARAEVSFVQLDVTRPMGTAVYDVVLSLECLEEVPDDQAALVAMATALRPGGLFVAHVPTADWSPALSGAAQTWRREVRHGYDPGELRSRVASVGLDVQQVVPSFRRMTALAQDIRDRCKHWPRASRLLFPLMAGAVRLEQAGLTWGPPRGLLVVAVKPVPASGGPHAVGQASAEPADTPAGSLHPEGETPFVPQ